MSKSRTFIDACLAGDAVAADIDDWIDRWHDADVPDLSLSLDEFLGFSEEEGRTWVGHPERLAAIINARRTFHLIYTDYGPDFGWSIESPQIPGLVGGRTDLNDLLRDTNMMLEFADAPVQDMHAPGVYLHEQHAITDPRGNDYLIRFLTSTDAEDNPSRISAASRLQGAVLEGWSEDEIESQPQLVTTERLLIAVTAEDTIGWIADQLGEGGCASLSKYNGGDVLLTIPFADGSLGAKSRRTLDSLGLGRGDTFGELANQIIAAEAFDLISEHSVTPAEDVAIVRGMTSV